MRNVTADGDRGGLGRDPVPLQRFGGPGSHTLTLTNSIAQGASDLRTEDSDGPGRIAVSNSNFDLVEEETPGAVTGDGQPDRRAAIRRRRAATTARPPDSPTIDAGSPAGIGPAGPRRQPQVARPGTRHRSVRVRPCRRAGAAALTSLAVSPKAFRPRKGGGAVVSKGGAKGRGTAVRYALTAAASVNFTVERALKGRRVGGKCRKQTEANREQEEVHPLPGAQERLRPPGRRRRERIPVLGPDRRQGPGAGEVPAGRHRGRLGQTGGVHDHAMMRRASASCFAAALLLPALLPGHAAATIYCVAEPSCPQGGIGATTLKNAVAAANEDATARHGEDRAGRIRQ